MKTPICDFVEGYSAKAPVRAHMPGHKGRGVTGVEKLDITEIPGADVLYHSDGIIRESEENASLLFGTARTLYSTEGSSLSIRAMLYLIKLYAASRKVPARILAGRNAHKVFISAAALLDIDVEWIYPTDGRYISCDITPARLDEMLSNSHGVTAVYITSPDYLGNLADTYRLSQVCHRHGVIFAVDNAHGAYLNFLAGGRHPISSGVDICCDSAHKTLPALTGGGYLHISKDAPAFFAENADRAMATFASTSPSYLILQSLDRLNAYLDGDFRHELAASAQAVEGLKAELVSHGYILVGDEPLKLTIATKPYGYSGGELAEILERAGIFCEFCDPDYLVLMFSPCLTSEEIERIGVVLCRVERRERILTEAPGVFPARQVVRPHEAILSPSEEIEAALSEGRVLAGLTVSCPPAIPIVSCGELIDANALELFEYFGIRRVSVIADR